MPHYQPQADVLTGEILAVEALARWSHPERGVLAPSVFLPQAEHGALMRPLTLAMLEHALADVVRRRAAGARIGVAVNLSVVHPDRRAAARRRAPLPGRGGGGARVLGAGDRRQERGDDGSRARVRRAR